MTLRTTKRDGRAHRGLWALSIACALGACSSASAPNKASLSDPTLIAEGRRWMAEFQCGRCHDGGELAAFPQEQHCVHCHQAILRDAFEAPRDVLERWNQTLSVSQNALRSAPSLDRAANFDRQWVRAFLLDPHDLRPALGPAMPRLALNESQASAIAAALVPSAELDDSLDHSLHNAQGGDAVRGEGLVTSGSCGSCHLRGGAPLGSAALRPERERELAPDLAEAARWQLGALIRWLLDPTAMDPDTTMPPTGLSLRDARDVAAFLRQPAPERANDAVPERLPVVNRPVGYAELEERVFRRICWHCHGDPAFARGQGGPGNTGGFGFAARHLDLSSYGGVLSGAINADGEHYSVLEPMELANGQSVPRVVAHLWARHFEVAQQTLNASDGTPLRGMPLGLPPMPLEEIQLLESWIAQGSRRDVSE